MQCFDIDGWTRRFRLRFITKNACRPLKELVFPLFDLVGVHVKLLGQFHKRLLAPDGGERHFCLESRAMVPARSSRHGLSCFRHLNRSQAEIPLILAVQFSRASSFIAEGPAEAVANMRTGLEYAKGSVSREVITISARDPALQEEAPRLAEGNSTAGRLYVFYEYLQLSSKSPQEIEAFLFTAMTKATAVNRIAPAYVLLADYLGRVKSKLLIKRVIALVLNNVGIFKLREMLSTGSSIYSLNASAIHMIFLSKCASIQQGMLRVDIREMKRFARDACQKSLYVNGFDAAPIKEARFYSFKVDGIQGLEPDTKKLLTQLEAKKHHSFNALFHGKADEWLTSPLTVFRPHES